MGQLGGGNTTNNQWIKLFIEGDLNGHVSESWNRLENVFRAYDFGTRNKTGDDI